MYNVDKQYILVVVNMWSKVTETQNMTSNKSPNVLSFTRLSFASEDTLLAGKMVDEVPFGTSTSSFHTHADAHSLTDLSGHEDLQSQILLFQIMQESDE